MPHSIAAWGFLDKPVRRPKTFWTTIAPSVYGGFPNARSLCGNIRLLSPTDLSEVAFFGGCFHLWRSWFEIVRLLQRSLCSGSVWQELHVLVSHLTEKVFDTPTACAVGFLSEVGCYAATTMRFRCLQPQAKGMPLPCPTAERIVP